MQTRRRQRGFSLPVILLGSLIVLVVMGGLYEFIRLQRLSERGKALATATAVYHNALIAYGLANRDALVKGEPVAGVLAATAPSCTELKGLMPALLDYSCSLPEKAGTPTLAVTPIPSGCSGTGCDLVISVTASNPLDADADGSEVLQRAVSSFGGEAGQSLVGQADTIYGVGWTRPNPLGSKPRVFGTHSTYGASTLSKFLTLSDTRDPNFKGNVSIALNLTVGGSIASSTGISVTDSAGCKRTEMTLTGQVIARDAACVDRVVASGTSGELETRSSAGAPQVKLGTGVQVFDSGGADKAGFRFSASLSEVYADNLVNASGTAGIRSDGSVYGKTATFTLLSVSQSQTPGSACSDNTFGRSSDGRWLECYGGLWRFVGIQQANAGDACISGFAQDITTATAPLICRNNVYVNLNQALGLVSIIDSLAVLDGSVVPVPTCAAGSTPALLTDFTRFQTPSSGGVARLSYTGSGPWTMSITGTSGGEAVVWRACQYASF